jgi:hypothetical protein
MFFRMKLSPFLSFSLCSSDLKKTKKAKKTRPDPEVATGVRESEVWKHAEEAAAAAGMAWVKKKRVSRQNTVADSLLAVHGYSVSGTPELNILLLCLSVAFNLVLGDLSKFEITKW